MTSQHHGDLGHAAASAASPDQIVELTLKHVELLAAQGRFEEALDALGPGLAADPNEPRLVHTRAWLLVNLWRLEEARITLEGLLGSHPELRGTRRLLSLTLLQLGEYSLAEREIDACLAQNPSDPMHHLQRARVLAAAAPERRDTRKLRRAARDHVDRALALAGNDPDVFDEAARVLGLLGRMHEALDVVRRGLAVAPQDASLLTLHAGLVTANTPARGRDTIHQEGVHAVQMGRLLASDPQHRDARTTLFAQLWFRTLVRIDSSLYVPAIAALGIMFSFVNTTADPIGVVVWWTIAGIVSGVQWLRFWAVGRRVPRGFRRSSAGSRAADSARRWAERVTLVALLATGVFAFVVAFSWRDAVMVRWALVALCALVLVAFVCSVAWQLGYLARARQFEGKPTDRDAVVRLALHRRGIAALVGVRCLAAAGLWLLFLVTYAVAGFGQSRDDVSAVILLATSCMVLSPLIGWCATWIAEQRDRRALDTAVTVDAKAPALWSPVVAAGLAACLLMMLVGGIFKMPITPNQYDSVGQYAVKVKAPRAGDDGNEEVNCGGTRTSRITCQLRNTRELSERPIEVPEIRPLDLPEFPDLSEAPVG